MASSSTIDIIINGVDNFTNTIGGAVDGIGDKLSGIGKTTGNVIGGTAVAGLGTFAAAATGVVGAVGGIGLALGDMAQDAAPIESMKTAFNDLAAQAGTTGEDMLAAMQKGSGGTIAARDLMEQFNKASSLVGDQFATELPTAMELVSKASAATGQDMGFLMDSLVTGVGRVSPMILDNLGVQVNLTEATEAYAEANGLVAGELTKTEQQMAVQEMVLGKLEEKYGEMPSVFDTTASKMAQLQASFQNAKDELGTAFLPVLTQLLDTFMPLITSIMPVLIPFVEAFATGIQTVFDALSPLLPIIEEFGTLIGEVGTLFAAGDVEGGVSLLSETIGGLTDQLVEVLPNILEFGAEMIINIVQGIADSLPSLMESAGTIITALIEAIVPLLPDMLTAGIDILLAIIQGISDTLVDLIPVAVELLTTLIDAVVENLPTIIETGVGILLAVIQGIIDALPDLIAAVPEIITTIVDAVVTNLPTILEAGVEILLAVIEGIISAIPDLTAAIPDIITAIIDAVIIALPQILEAGVEILNALIEGIITSIPVLIEALPEIWDELTGWFEEKDWGEIGAGIVEGIGEGLERTWELLTTAFTGLLEKLPKWAKKLLGIDSPSKVFMEIGGNVSKGFAKGIEDNIRLPERAVGRLANIRPGQPAFGNNNTYNYTVNMPTSSNPADLITAFELLQAYGGT